MKKIGILGGTFSPIHIGHLMLGKRALEEYGLDSVVFLPNGNPPHKSGSKVLDGFHRGEMVRLAIEGVKGFVFSDMEIKNETFSYTAETMARFCDMDPDAEYYFIMGADSLDYIDEWYHPEDIFKRCIILAGQRGDLGQIEMDKKIVELKSKYDADIRLLHIPNVAISSNWIRGAIKDGFSIHYYVPDPVEEYIYRNCLYRD